MAEAAGMRGKRSRNENGRVRDTRDDKHVGTLEKQYDRDFGVRSDMHVGTLLKKTGMSSVNELIESGKSRKVQGIRAGGRSLPREHGLGFGRLFDDLRDRLPSKISETVDRYRLWIDGQDRIRTIGALEPWETEFCR